ncbi:MAG: amidohydrolase [Syntrophobacteraceae bacterium]
MSGNSLEKRADRPQPLEVDWLLFNADWLITCAPGIKSRRGGAVAVRGDRIVAAGDSDKIRTVFRGRSELDLSGHILMPGLVNTHTHAAMSLFRGLADDLPLQKWLEEAVFPAEAAFINPDTVYTGTLLSAVEMLKGGTTTFCDGYFFEESAARAARESGMRAVMGQGILDFPTPDQPDPARARERAEAFLASFPDFAGRVRPSLFCHAPYTCSPETLEWVKKMCRDAGVLFQTHLSETAGEVEEIVRRYGRRPALHLESLGILDELTLCAHGIWLSQDEIDALAGSGASISHCPESAMKLASGTAPLPALIAAGVKVGLGTDGCASNNDLDLFAEMDTAAKLHKVFENDPLACPAERALRMATAGAAAALGLGAETGSIELGKKADIIAIDCNQPHLLPMYDPVSHVVYSARRSDVRFVWVDGAQVVAGGVVLTADEAAVIAEANRVGREIARRRTDDG